MLRSLSLLALSVSGAPAVAQTTVTLMHDNDEWAGTEKEYAQGSRLSVVSEDWGKSGWSLYPFASANARYQAYDLFLDEPGGEDGDVVRGGSAVTSEKSRTETSLGVVAANGPARLTLAWTEESRHCDQQPDKHKCGEVTLGWAFYGVGPFTPVTAGLPFATAFL